MGNSGISALVAILAGALFTWAGGCAAAGGNSDSAAFNSCVAGSAVSCMCGDGRVLTTMCLPDGSNFEPCPCGVTAAGGLMQPGQSTGTGGAPGGTGTGLPGSGGSAAIGTGGTGTTGTGGMGGVPMTGSGGMLGSAGTGGVPTSGSGGIGGSGGMTGTGGATGTGGTTGTTGTGGASGGTTSTNLSGLSDAELDMLRQTCVDEINMYRAMLGLTPLMRATPEQEMCSDQGAQMDGDSGVAHGSAKAGLCRSVGLGAEDTCPGWQIGGFSGNATVEDALKGCLAAMWDEGPPPAGTTVDQCIQDSSGCFQQHGHYINMSSSTSSIVACSFYKMMNGAEWMNQDFGR